MKELPAISNLIQALNKLPGVGKKSAERMAYALLEMDDVDLKEIAASFIDLKDKIHPCPVCGIYTDQDQCEICKDKNRNHQQLVVVSYPKDIYAFERIEGFNGVYHVLGGVLSAIKGISIQELNIDSLLRRIDEENIQEVILATEPTINGETTAMYIAKILEKKPIKLTRIGYGLPFGANLDYADSMTLDHALKGRTNIKEDK